MPIPVVLAASALLLGAAPPGLRPSCDGLSRVHQVSYKSQEARLFERVVALVQTGGGVVPEGEDVARGFDSCLDALQQRLADDGTAVPMQRALARVKRSFTKDGAALTIQLPGRLPRSHALDRDPAELGKRVVSRTVRDLALDGASRADFTNLLWFAWFEAYIRATQQRYNGYDYADELALEQARDRGRSFAIGFEPEMAEGHLLVGEIRDERLRAEGLTEGSEVTALDGHPLGKMSLSEYQQYWLREKPFAFELQATAEELAYRVRGESIPVRHQTIAWGFDGDVAYVRILRFASETLVEMRRALSAAAARKAHRLVLDLRRNPGGRVQSGLVDIFFKPGQIVMSYQELGGDEPVDIDASVEYNDLPIALLIDRDTASMAEALAAAFKKHGRGKLFGETTTGKGVGQTQHPVLEEGRLHLVTTAYYYPGNRESWNGVGIEPDVQVPIDDETRKRLLPYLDSTLLHIKEQKPFDPVLQRAMEWLEETP